MIHVRNVDAPVDVFTRNVDAPVDVFINHPNNYEIMYARTLKLALKSARTSINFIMTVKDLYNSTKDLKAAEKALLVDMILSDLDKPDIQVEDLWIKKVNSRSKSIKTDKPKPPSYQQVMGKHK